MKWKDAEAVVLKEWFSTNQRELPWRQTSDPYKIWISEVMLQQTTSTAVIPFYQKFTKRLPTLKKLANTKDSTVKELWAGLGYYSRARNLHKAAKILTTYKEFPQTYTELIKLPGFGDYTSRSVSSIAFKESVGVIDGNVIRVFSRRFNQPWEWWKTKDKKELQNLADAIVTGQDSSIINQALMELGATICTPKNPACLICPWLKTCKSRKKGSHLELPLRKPKKSKKIWQLTFYINKSGNKLLLEKNTKAPFLKNEYLFPLKIKDLAVKPTKYNYKHSITNNEIYIKISTAKQKPKKDHLWVVPIKIKSISPFSLLEKALNQL